MTVTVTQTCDGCGASRIIIDKGRHQDGGWRDVSGGGEHLCAECISRALAGRTTSDAGSES